MAKKYANDLSSKKPFERAFVAFKGKHDLGRLFKDFLEITVASLMRDEEIYEEHIKGYTAEEIEYFAQAFGDLVNEMEKSLDSKLVSKDILGEFYQTFITRGEHGQFFTPEHVSDFMAQILVGDPVVVEGVTKVQNTIDPCCGSGRTLLGAAKAFGKNGVYLTGVDLDRRCSLMTVINLFMNGLNGEVYNANSLSNEIFAGRRFGVSLGIPIIMKIDIDNMPKEKKEAIEEQVKIRQENPQMQSLFDI